LTSIIIPDSVTEIGRCAFSNCNNLEAIIVPQGTKDVFVQMFKDAEIEQNIINCIQEEIIVRT
jgi:hypothetical protein